MEEVGDGVEEAGESVGEGEGEDPGEVGEEECEEERDVDEVVEPATKVPPAKIIGGSHLTWNSGSEGRGQADLEFVTRVMSLAREKYFLAQGNFSRINAKNYPICVICYI